MRKKTAPPPEDLETPPPTGKNYLVGRGRMGNIAKNDLGNLETARTVYTKIQDVEVPPTKTADEQACTH
jgi:hypothetical protein